jgi:hypothetical protein
MFGLRPEAKTADESVITPLHYDDYDWRELPPKAKEAAACLGYTEKLWNEDGTPASDDKDWDELSPDEQAAALVLGYNKDKWDSSDSSSSS